jgi:hypothetical protein
MLNKQTAVDIFHNRVNELIKEKKTITTFVVDGIWLECKEMEKEQKKHAYDWGETNAADECNGDGATHENFEEYYNETYGGNK